MDLDAGARGRENGPAQRFLYSQLGKLHRVEISPDTADREKSAQALVLLAYHLRASFENLIHGAGFATDCETRTALHRLAVRRWQQYETVEAELLQRTVDLAHSLTTWNKELGSFQEATTPQNWLEVLVGISLGEGFYKDLWRVLSPGIPHEEIALVSEILTDESFAQFAEPLIAEELAHHPAARHTVALWTRRLWGEMWVKTHVQVSRSATLTELFETVNAHTHSGIWEDMIAGHEIRLRTLGVLGSH